MSISFYDNGLNLCNSGGLLAVVFAQPDGFYVLLRLLDQEVDEAGPFDDLDDAVQMAQRATEDGGSVEVQASIRLTELAVMRRGAVRGPDGRVCAVPTMEAA